MLSVVFRICVLICFVSVVAGGPPPAKPPPSNATAHAPPSDASKHEPHQMHSMPSMHKPSALLSFGKAVADIPVAIVETCKDVAEGIASLVKGFFVSLLNR